MGALIEIDVPDIGDFTDVKVVEVMVKPGDRVAIDDSLITIESDKASMEVPSTQAGIVRELRVKLGEKVSEGSAIVVIEAEATADASPVNGSPAGAPPASVAAATQVRAAPAASMQAAAPSITAVAAPPPASHPPAVNSTANGVARPPHASPAVRKFARQLGVDLTLLEGSGRYGRIFRTDVEQYVKAALADGGKAGAGLELAPWPKVDFSKFGPIETQPLSRIRRSSKANLARNWVMIPHVTQFDEADITELEAFRQETNRSRGAEAVRVTLLAFILKALVAALRAYPEFNSSLEGDNLILKKYFHLGFAADTPEGLIVPVVRDVDQKGVLQLATDTAALAAAARAGKLKLTEIQGGCFTVSSLGGIGGTMFTPIINAPEVAILGVSRMVTKPVWRDGAFIPRQILPLSLSYDHRVIDGAVAARFVTYLADVLADLRRALL